MHNGFSIAFMTHGKRLLSHTYFRRKLLEHGMIDPEVDVAPPILLLLDGRHLGQCTMVYSATQLHAARARFQPTLLQSYVVKPRIILVGTRYQRLLILLASFQQNRIFNILALAVLLLKLRGGSEQRTIMRHLVEGELEDGTRTLYFLETRFEACEGDVKLRVSVLAWMKQLVGLDRLLVDIARIIYRERGRGE